ncbi:MAG: hypothetical protein ACI9TV_002510 [Sulfurimonas sp.]|jgi:hypothetical protein|uniref:hypothetical protein n=1 Tax=Sulfurimonas sp. TaxID=2022749 RepID=UPI0039E388D5
MNPSNKEMQLRKNCQLYAYVLVSQDKEIPEEIQDSIDSYEYIMNCVEELSAELKSLDSDTFDRIVNNTELLEARELAYWWEMREEADRLHKSLSSDV